MFPATAHPPISLTLILVALMELLTPVFSSAASRNPDLKGGRLEKWDSVGEVDLKEFSGKIIVLDFFAYWCGPCRQASREIQTGIQAYYTARGGNVSAVPVQVISINIERDNPHLTRQFIAEAGLDLVLNDPEGKLLEQLGGTGTPFILVVDASKAEDPQTGFPILYQRFGFEGIGKLRQVIDSIPAPSTTLPHRGDAEPPVAPLPKGPPTSHQANLSVDAMLAPDVRVTSTTLGYGQAQGGTEWKLAYTHSTYSIDYEPFSSFDFLGSPVRIDDEYNGAQASLKQRLHDRISVLVSGAVYQGFTDYRSLWLANYYRQQFGFVPGYQAPEPRGASVSTGVRWEYLPAAGFLEASFLYARDTIAPGYELDQNNGDLLRGRETLETLAPSLRLENILTRRLRMLNELRLTSTSGRDPRFSYSGSLNLALGEKWVLRTSGGYTRENPTLRAFFVGTTLELEVSPHWFLNLFGLYYHDTGEIENTLFISTAAPGLETQQVGAGVRYQGRAGAFSLSAGPLRARYEPLSAGTRPFTNLYQDRTWLYLRGAWSLEF